MMSMAETISVNRSMKNQPDLQYRRKSSPGSTIHRMPSMFEDGRYSKAHDDHIHRKDHVQNPIHHEKPVDGLRRRHEGDLEWRENGDE